MTTGLATTMDVQGFTADRFASVREVFVENFSEDGERAGELGAGFAAWVAGAGVVDLRAGFADRQRTRPFAADTLTPVFSVTKVLAAVMVARLVQAGKLAYAQPVAEVWPEFAQGDKGAITVEQALSHQAGLPGFLDPMDPTLWFDGDAICDKLAAMAPLWPPGSASGYHPVTFGYLAGEIFRRVDGRTLGTALREDIAGPCGLDLWIGLPDSEHARCAELVKPPSMPRFGELNDATRAAFLTPWASPGGRGTAAWRRAEIPSANGHATAAALARFAGALATDGGLNGVEILSPQGVAEMARRRIAGDDLVLKGYIAWGAGVMRNEGRDPLGPGRETFGHYGWGGSCLFVDPEHGVGGAYVMNRQSSHLIGDPRAKRLIAAVYAAL